MNMKLISASLAIVAICALSSEIANAGMRLPNGVSANGVRLNGMRLNGMRLNGQNLNGVALNGVRLNGIPANGVQQWSSITILSVKTVTLPDGSSIPTDGSGVTLK